MSVRRSPRLTVAAKTRSIEDDPNDSPPAKRIKAEQQHPTTAVTPSPPPKKTSPASKKAGTKKARRNNSKPEPGSKAPPKGWEEIYSLVEELRQDKTAPLDADGAEALPETDQGDKGFRFQVLIALMLSSQTKDHVVGETMRALQKHGLSIENIHNNTPKEQLNALIGKVGFHNNKTKYIKEACQVLLEKYDGDIPRTAKEMMELKGIGPKMAYLIENIAWGTYSGIGVDTHMHRLFVMLKWVPESKYPETTRVHLEAWLPREKWPTVNYYWVGFGQEVQQQKAKILRKSLDCSRPYEALRLLKRVGLDPVKEGDKEGWGDEVRLALKEKPKPAQTTSE
ncbi:Endonuclease III-like protein 1 [Seminavis robusta]|uniref:DNA-(apurinic or apyrimidinic site) lyase n=1 Tax=Seminavis robusta TaxID=568900 RepID=A0A9N8EMM2_9STRA|nr:Endonuclease III-like protein 1 [Seminavis robusta]|eukprot:Sro1481_g276210.1 Endonuclease III-like protein 1 (339) ;mRNA; f:11012-12028